MDSGLQARATHDKLTLKDEVNACLERALVSGGATGSAWKAMTHHLGGIRTDPGKVWGLVDALEAEAYAAKRELAK